MIRARRTFKIVALIGLAGCYFKTPTHRSEVDGGSELLDATLEDAETEVEPDADIIVEDDDGGATCMCSAPTAICIPETLRCVECQNDDHCRGSSVTHCLVSTGQCVACLDASHCANQASASVCDTATHRCAPCRANADCNNIAGASVCNAGTCVQCTPDQRTACGEDKPVCNAQSMCATCGADADCQGFGKVCDEANARCVACTPDSEKVQCGSKSCDPVTKQCTQTDRGSVAQCRKCLADSECMVDQRCIDLSFAGSPRGSYCMQLTSTATCTRPFQAASITKPSRSGAPAESYCGIVEQRTSCEAVLLLEAAQPCSDASQCGAPGAICGIINGGKTCTYACESNFDCTLSTSCVGSGADKYCGVI